jgi:hypothetical protein
MVRLAPPPGPKAPSFFCSHDSRTSVAVGVRSQGFSRQTPTSPQSPVTVQAQPSVGRTAVAHAEAAVAFASRQKPQNTRCCVPDGAAVFEM